MKVSIAITLLNEEKAIKSLLNSLLSQTQNPSEIVIVDAGSTDETIKIIKNSQKKNKSIKLFVKKGLNIAQGRNLAIKKSKNEIIAIIDGGCIAKKDWLEKITQPFEDPKIEHVAGFYEMTGESNLQKAAKLFLGVLPQNFKQDNFLPSARSMAFKKSFWKRLGGFEEKFSFAGEDTHFNYKALLNYSNIARQKKAIVYWEVPKSFKSLIRKFFLYAVGDGEMLKITKKFNHHSIKIFSIYLRYLIMFLLFPFTAILLIIYLFWSINKFSKIKKTWQTTILIPIIQIASDFAVMAGFLYGISKRNN
ncbi:glycosyltransferase [Candidatus Woesebacteria bacterium]|nr:glycosyltransferase [Candidatus Woesebacteria bacterium]QQG47147.1 MAG: glycosyltransferase [Candidatus Woesebacteria bacterium]